MSTLDRHELTQAGYDNINANRSVDPDVMHDLGYAPIDDLDKTVEGVLGGVATERIFHVNQIGRTNISETAPKSGGQLELVDDQHEPRPDADKESKLRPRFPARTWQEKAAADQAPPSQRKTEFGHDQPPLTGIRGDKR